MESVKSSDQFQLNAGKIKAVIDARDLNVRGFKDQMRTISDTFKDRVNLEHSQGASLSVLQLSSIYVGAGDLEVEELSADLSAGDELLFSNGGVFTVAEDTAIGSTKLKGTFAGEFPLAKGERAALQNLDFFDAEVDGLIVNDRISGNPALLHASLTGDAGDNEMALRLAAIIDEKQGELSGQTFGEAINSEVVGFGQELNSVETQAMDQGTVIRMLKEHRNTIGGVSIDEEMANLLVFQRAFQANARLISLLDGLYETSINIIK